MPAGGVFALLDLVVVSVGLYVFMNKKTYAHRYIFPGVAGMVCLSSSLLPTLHRIAFTNYSVQILLSIEQARDYHLKTAKVRAVNSFHPPGVVRTTVSACCNRTSNPLSVNLLLC